MNTKGNALFLILIAVALFAALSYAITSSSRGGGSIGKEQASISAGEIVQYATQIEQTITRLRVINGCSDTQISFWYDSNGDSAESGLDRYYNSVSPSDKRCHVFEPAGGNLNYAPVNLNFIDTSFSAAVGYNALDFSRSVQVIGVGNDCDDPSCSDLVLIIPYLKKEICENISKKMTGSLTPYVADAGGTHYSKPFNGTYEYYAFSDNGKIGSGIASETNLIGKPIGCFDRTGGSSDTRGYVYYHTLIAR